MFAAVDARLLARKPATLSMREAAALPLAVITAWEGLVDRAGVRAGQKVLVHGGAGGVGSVAVQVAAARGAEVFATASAARTPLVRRLGAVPIDYTSVPVERYVAEHTGGAGFDIVFDTVGGSVLDASFEAVRTYPRRRGGRPQVRGERYGRRQGRRRRRAVTPPRTARPVRGP
ncbi:zinc-binding dehydrogenase [Streptomyces werraensis]|uniref:zinc-binding dehydrogenase n=1 Tax=Streptomyces werraensis TaxID=68284 RepID=UPI003447C2B9